MTELYRWVHLTVAVLGEARARFANARGRSLCRPVPRPVALVL
jgi:hypothetical protein